MTSGSTTNTATGTTTGGDGGASSTSSAGGSTSTSTASGDGGGLETGGAGSSPSTLQGYWVWSKQIENGVVTLEISDEDMEPRVGPSGWPGCPEGILCTRHGIHKVAFEGVRFHQQHNVTTSSDFHTLGTFVDDLEDTATFQREEQFSCAHPDAVNADVVDGGFRYRHEAGELWISVAGFGGFPFADPGAEPTTWIVYKAVEREDYYGRYMIRLCQPFDEFTCHEGCVDPTLVDEG